PVGADPRFALAVDLNGDGHLDLATPDYEADDVSVLLGDGKGGFGPATAFAAGGEPPALAAADLDEGGIVDLVTANTETDDATMLIGDGTGRFAPPVHFAAGDYAHSVVAVDVDEDGHLDLVTSNFRTDDASVLLGDGAGSFAPAQHVACGTDPRSAIAADLDEDGHLDLVVVDVSVDLVSVLLNVTFQGDEYRCRDGNVNAAAGAVTPVLFVNGLKGQGGARQVIVDQDALFQIRMKAPPSKPDGPSAFSLYAWLGKPGPGTVSGTPYGPLCMRPGVGPGHPKKTWNNTGDPMLGMPNLPSTPAPSAVLRPHP